MVSLKVAEFSWQVRLRLRSSSSIIWTDMDWHCNWFFLKIFTSQLNLSNVWVDELGLSVVIPKEQVWAVYF